VVVSKGTTILPEDLPIFRTEYTAPPAVNSLRDMEKAHIAQILDENRWNISKSANLLGIDRSTLYSKIKLYNLSKI
jgi:transcriptional regulator of acetoin/glycerol metabolism